MRPFFSILVPVYNQVGKMDECIASLRAQTFPDFEAIFVDDGSTDASWPMLQGFVEQDERMSAVQHGENRSLLAARYTGMSHAKGEYILFLDSDDYLSDDALECLRNKLAAEPVDILRFGYRTEPQGVEFLPPEADDPLKSNLAGEIKPSICQNCYQRRVIEALLEKTGPFYCNMSEDACLSGMLLSCAGSFAKLDRCLYHYNAGGMSSQTANFSLAKMDRDMQSVSAAGEHLVAFIEENKPEYAPLARRSADRMIQYVIFQHILFDESWDHVFDYLRYVKDGKHSRFFNMACNKLIPIRVKVLLGIRLTQEEKEHIFDE